MSRLTSRVPVLVSSLLALGGCATSGHVWVQQPEDALTPTTPPELERSELAAQNALAVALAPESGTVPHREPPRPRLNRVVSLGEAAPSSPAPGANIDVGVASGPAPVVVNIVNYAAPSYGYAPVYPQSYGSSSGHRAPIAGATRLAPVSAGPPGTPPLAGDWQTPRSHGPTFPYHAGPASPWERAR